MEAGKTFAIVGGGRPAFVAGDLVHVRRNDYRSKRTESELDVLNGYQGVALDVAGDSQQAVLVEWRCPSRDGGHRCRRLRTLCSAADGYGGSNFARRRPLRISCLKHCHS